MSPRPNNEWEISGGIYACNFNLIFRSSRDFFWHDVYIGIFFDEISIIVFFHLLRSRVAYCILFRLARLVGDDKFYHLWRLVTLAPPYYGNEMGFSLNSLSLVFTRLFRLTYKIIYFFSYKRIRHERKKKCIASRHIPTIKIQTLSRLISGNILIFIRWIRDVINILFIDIL